MQNNLRLTEDEPKRFSVFRLPRAARLAIYLPIVGMISFYSLRRVEHFLTHHPVRYIPGPEWNLPPNAEEVWIKVAGGQRIHGWYLKSPNQPASATVLHCHGNGGNITNTAWYGVELTDAGLDVLMIDYRGYGRSDGDVTDEWALNADGEAAYDYLTTARGVKPEKLVMYGMSLGSTVAIDVASRRPVGALIVESGLSSASEMGEHSLPILPRWLHRLARNRFESARKIADVKCPVLVTHGTNDQTIPVTQGRRLYESARDPKQLIIIEGGDHNLAGRQGKEYFNQVTEFIHKAMNGGNK